MAGRQRSSPGRAGQGTATQGRGRAKIGSVDLEFRRDPSLILEALMKRLRTRGGGSPFSADYPPGVPRLDCIFSAALFLRIKRCSRSRCNPQQGARRAGSHARTIVPRAVVTSIRLNRSICTAPASTHRTITSMVGIVSIRQTCSTPTAILVLWRSPTRGSAGCTTPCRRGSRFG